jgi:hypothetical protein
MKHATPRHQDVVVLARKWAGMHPGLATRLERAIALVANVIPGDFSPNVFFVEGSEGHRYMVRVDRKNRTSSCTCADSKVHGDRCKHRLAVALYETATSQVALAFG